MFYFCQLTEYFLTTVQVKSLKSDQILINTGWPSIENAFFLYKECINFIHYIFSASLKHHDEHQRQEEGDEVHV